jgi:hypothetical protein
MSRDKIPHKEAITFCRWHLGKGCFAPLTGQDWPAWIAFCYLLTCWGCGGGTMAIAAMRATVASAQSTPAVRRVFVQAIPAMLDWCHVAQLWPQLVDGDDAGMMAVERAA